MLERLFRIARAKDDELGVMPLERGLQLVLVLDADDELDVIAELEFLRRSDDPRVGGRVTRGQDRQRARRADGVEVAVNEERLCTARLGALCCFWPVDGDDQRDAVTLGYGLAQTSRAGHAAQWYLGGFGYRDVMRLRLAIVAVAAALPAVAGGAVQATVLGTPRADFLAGSEASDRIVARAGNDRISAEYDGGNDRVSCGAGRDVVAADARDRIESDCELISRRIHRDRHANPESQHESEVEPDSHTVGQTTVAVFQVGRNRTGGAASIGFSTSKDGGRTWREGTLPGLTANTTPPGPSARASDPVVAYDAAHGLWLANTLAIAADATRLTIHRSSDGLSWSAPIDAALARTENLAYDKNWLTCDNGAASPYRGRCYLAYTQIGERADDLAVQRSDDGGRTWSAAVTRRIAVTGVIPVVQPDGKLVLVFWSPRTGMVAVPSTDGGVTLGEPVVISELQAREAKLLRAPPLVAAEVDASGRALVVWQDCRFRAGCAANDVVVSRSADGTNWSTPMRVTSGRNAVIPTVGVEPGSGRLAIAYYVIHPNGIDAELVTSTDGVRWSTPQRLNPRRMPLTWLPQTTRGRMLADYIGATWSNGRPLVVYALASPPKRGELRQAIYAARG